jgi:hypothetical protein
MVAKFKVGDKARVVYVRTVVDSAWREGVEVVVLSTICGINPFTKNPYEYIVQALGCQPAYVLADQLEPLTGSWDEIFQATGWKRPSKLSQPSQTLVESHKVPEGIVG